MAWLEQLLYENDGAGRDGPSIGPTAYNDAILSSFDFSIESFDTMLRATGAAFAD